MFFLLTAIIMMISRSAAGEDDRSLFLSSGEKNANIAKCVLKLSAKYFVEKKALSGSIVIININSYSSTTQQTLLKTIHTGSKYSVMVKDSAFKHKNASHFPEKAKNYMMILESVSELEQNIFQLNRLPTWNPHAKAVIYIELKSENNLDELVIGIINKLRSYKLLRTIVIVDFPKLMELRAYSWRPYSDTNCGGPCKEVFLMDVCRNNIIKEKTPQEDMFPYNMRLCPLTIYAAISEPYVMPPTKKITDSVYDDEYHFDLGIEVNLMKIIGHFTNMTVILRMSNAPENRGTLQKDGNASGLFERLKNEDVDIIIGNMEVNRDIRKWFDPSSTYIQDEITWCVPKAAAAPTWANLITIFKWSTWMTTLSSIILISSMLHWFKYQENPNLTKWPTKSILMTLGMILGWGALFKPQTLSFRILLLSWLVFSMNINTAYQSFLRSFLIHPKYEKQIQTEIEVIRNKLGVGGRASLKEYFNNTDPVAHAIHEKWEDCPNLPECVKRAGNLRSFAVAASKRQVDYHQQLLSKGSSLLYCFQEGNIIYKYGVVIVARKYFPIIGRLNNILRRVSESGLIWKWNNEVFLRKPVSVDNSDEIPLSVEHMLGAFLFLVFGLAVSFVVCLVEIIWVLSIKFSKRFKKKYQYRKFLQ